MNVEIGAEAAQFPEKEYINGIAFAVQVEITLFKISTEFLRDILKFPKEFSVFLFGNVPIIFR